MDIKILDQTSEDVLEVTHLLRDTWLETYPNEEQGITREDILSRYDENNPRHQQRIAERMEKLKGGQADPEIHSWVAKDGEKIVGFCSAYKRDHARIQAIYVLPEYQGKGVGAKLMQTALEWIGEGKDVYIDVASYNQKAISFYEKFGFKKTGREFTDEMFRFPSGAIIPETEMVRR